MSTHLYSAPIEVLEATLCQDCQTANMAEYACQSYMKDNEAICIDCCGCPDHEEDN